MLVDILATERTARELLAVEGLTVKTENGRGRKPHPAVRIMETARRQAAPLMKQFLEPAPPRAAKRPGAPAAPASVWEGILS